MNLWFKKPELSPPKNREGNLLRVCPRNGVLDVGGRKRGEEESQNYEKFGGGDKCPFQTWMRISRQFQGPEVCDKAVAASPATRFHLFRLDLVIQHVFVSHSVASKEAR